MQFIVYRVALPIAIVLLVGACGLIADKDQILVAMLDGKPIIRKDLRDALYAMKDEERGVYVNRGDLERFLRAYVDRRIVEDLAMELSTDKKINVTREEAAARYFAEHPDEAMIPTITDPKPLEITMEQLDTWKSTIEYEIDLILDKMLQERAVQYFAAQSLQEGLIAISDEEYQREYDIQKANLNSLEYIDFIALRFPKEMPNAVTVASDVRRRIDAGESFDAILEEVLRRDERFVLASRFENNPASANFRSFWMSATGAEKGQIIGPVFIPAYSLMDNQGKTVQMPDAYLVLQVQEHHPPTTLSLEEAKPFLTQVIALRNAVELLREQHGVEFYDEMLWEPGGVGDRNLQA